MDNIENLNQNEQQIEVESVSNLNVDTSKVRPEIKRLRRWWIIVVPLLIVAMFTFLPAMNLAFREIFRGYDYFGMQPELLDYFEENGQRFPTAEKWCDAALENEGDYNCFKLFESSKDDFPYTLNKHIPGLKEIPDDVVVFFIGTPGWNQIGDYEAIKNQDRVKVLFGNGQPETFRTSQLPYLKWKPEDSGVIPEPDVQRPLMLMTVSLAIVFLCILIICRKSLNIFWTFALVMGIVSAGMGTWLGGSAEEAYYRVSSTSSYLTPWVGSLWGVVIGVCFVGVIGRIYKKYNANVSMLGYSTVIGIITGIAASAIVHGYMMIAYEEESFAFMVTATLSFGTIAGFLLGWISSGAIKLYRKTLQTGVENG